MELKSLQDNCLQVIGEHIDRFCNVFNTTKDAKLKRNFEFLQRCYSDRILQVLSISDDVKEDYFPLLINKYLTEFNLCILDFVDVETVIRIIAEIGEGLLKISFSLYKNLSSAALADIFPYLKNLKVLNMKDTCNDDALKNIAKYCPYLVELNIASSHVTNEGLRKYLCQKNDGNEVPNLNLRRLNLDRTAVEADIAQLILTSFPQLEVLEAPCMPCVLHEMHQKDIDQNNTANLKKYKLIHLDAKRCYFKFALTGHIESSPQLLKFYSLMCPSVRVLTAVVVNADQLNTLKTFTKLENVDLEANQSSPRPCANNFLNNRGERLTVLKLTQFSIAVEVLINNCSLLEELYLINISFQPVDETSKKELKFLNKMYLDGLICSDVATSKSISTLISSAPKLEKICFTLCRSFSDEFKEALKYCCIHCPLRKIYFFHSEPDFPTLQSILLSSRLLKKLRVVDSSFFLRTLLTSDEIKILTDLASRLKKGPDSGFENVDSDINPEDNFRRMLYFYDDFSVRHEIYDDNSVFYYYDADNDDYDFYDDF